MSESAIRAARQDDLRAIEDLYLFTMDARDFFEHMGFEECTIDDFFEHMGFEECTIDDFSEPGRKSTQWRALSERPDIAKILTAMRMRLDS